MEISDKCLASHCMLFQAFRWSLQAKGAPYIYESEKEPGQVDFHCRELGNDNIKIITAYPTIPVTSMVEPLPESRLALRLKFHHKIVQKLKSRTIFQKFISDKAEYLSALEIYRSKNLALRWQGNFHDIKSLQYSLHDYVQIIFDYIICSAFLISRECNKPSLSFSLSDTEIDVSTKNRISNNSVLLAKKLRTQLIEDYEGVFPNELIEKGLKAIISKNLAKIDRLSFKLKNSKQKAEARSKGTGLPNSIQFDDPEVKLSPSIKRKLIIREIALTAKYCLYFQRSDENRFPSDVIYELLPMFGISLTKRRIDDILSEYDKTRISEIIKNNPNELKDKKRYFQPLNTYTTHLWCGEGGYPKYVKKY